MISIARSKLEALLGAPWIQGESDCLTITLRALEILGVPERLRPNPWGELCAAWGAGDLPRALVAGCFPKGWKPCAVTPNPPQVGVVLSSHRMDGGSRTHVGAVAFGSVWTASRRAGAVAIPWFRAYPEALECWSLPPEFLTC